MSLSLQLKLSEVFLAKHNIRHGRRTYRMEELIVVDFRTLAIQDFEVLERLLGDNLATALMEIYLLFAQ